MTCIGWHSWPSGRRGILETLVNTRFWDKQIRSFYPETGIANAKRCESSFWYNRTRSGTPEWVPVLSGVRWRLGIAKEKP